MHSLFKSVSKYAVTVLMILTKEKNRKRKPSIITHTQNSTTHKMDHG